MRNTRTITEINCDRCNYMSLYAEDFTVLSFSVDDEETHAVEFCMSCFPRTDMHRISIEAQLANGVTL